MCSDNLHETSTAAPSEGVQYGNAHHCFSCLKVISCDAYDAMRCNHCGGRMFFDQLIEIKHPWADYKRPDIYEGAGNDYVPPWMENVEW